MRPLRVTLRSSLTQWADGHLASAVLPEGADALHALVHRVTSLHREFGAVSASLDEVAWAAEHGPAQLRALANEIARTTDGDADGHLSPEETAQYVASLVELVAPGVELAELGAPAADIPSGMRNYLPAIGLVLGHTTDKGVMEDRADPGFLAYALGRNTDIGRALKVSRQARRRLADAPSAAELVDAFLATDRVGKDGTLGAGSYWAASPIPGHASAYASDVVFAAASVAGPDPLAIRRVEDPAALPVGWQAAGVGAAAGGVAALVAARALYAVDLRDLGLTAQPGHPPLVPGYALHGVIGGVLTPLGIWLDGVWALPGTAGWPAARTQLATLQTARHELRTHLGHVHFGLLGMVNAVRATCTALAAQSPTARVVERLVHPHIRFVRFNMAVGADTLIRHGGLTDLVLAPDHVSAMTLARQAVLDWDAARLSPAADVAARGCGDAASLPYYPYRDRGVRLWDAIHRFVSDALRGLAEEDVAQFTADFRVAIAQALAHIVDELTEVHGLPAPGPMPGFGVAGASLVELLTGLIATSSFIHAAVNYPQLEHMMVVPAWPGSADAAAGLPSGDRAALQMEVLYLLGCRRYDRLGQAEYVAVEPGAIARLRQRLDVLEAEFTAEESANAAHLAEGRIPYPYLHPTWVPAAANV